MSLELSMNPPRELLLLPFFAKLLLLTCSSWLKALSEPCLQSCPLASQLSHTTDTRSLPAFSLALSICHVSCVNDGTKNNTHKPDSG
jgi:hypothetical protein